MTTFNPTHVLLCDVVQRVPSRHPHLDTIASKGEEVECLKTYRGLGCYECHTADGRTFHVRFQSLGPMGK